MSNTASQPLCQELYELLGWGKNDRIQWYKEIAVMGVGKDTIVAGLHQAGTGNAICPAYTLGYLMRKLPSHTVIAKLSGNYMASCDASIADLIRPELQNQTFADTPEDALCGLAIELAKAGILKRSES